MNEKLNKLKQTVKNHRTEIIAISVAAVSLGITTCFVSEEIKRSKQPYLQMSNRTAKFLLSDENNSVRFDTKFGPFILKALIDSEK